MESLGNTNKPGEGNAGIVLQLMIAHHPPGVPESRRSAIGALVERMGHLLL